MRVRRRPRPVPCCGAPTPGKVIGPSFAADEIADAVLFVASDKAAWMTGDTIAVDGGRHLTCLR